DGRPSRQATLAPMLAKTGVERSLVELEAPVGSWSSKRFTGVLVSADGLAVVPSVRLSSAKAPEGMVAAGDITVVGRPGVRCTEIVTVQAELALIRLVGLTPPSEAEGDAPPPVGPAGAAGVGEIVATVDAGSPVRSVGFVTALDRHPGTVEPDGPRWG